MAQHLTDYGRDLKIKDGLATLLDELCARATRADTWLRLMYAYPHGISDQLIATMAAHPQICSLPGHAAPARAPRDAAAYAPAAGYRPHQKHHPRSARRHARYRRSARPSSSASPAKRARNLTALLVLPGRKSSLIGSACSATRRSQARTAATLPEPGAPRTRDRTALE